MKLIRTLILGLLAVTAFAVVSCGPAKEDKSNSDEFAKAEESLKDQIKDVAYNIPSPSEIPYLLQATGAEFNQSLINDKKKAEKYGTKSDKAALNLGIYAADIGYLASYDKTQDAIDYINSSKALAENLGVVGSFDIGVLKRFEANIANKDSLGAIVDEAIKKTDKYLQDDSRNKLAALLITGSFVEGLYISTGLIKSYPKNVLSDQDRNLILTPLMRVVLEQKRSVDALIRMLNAVDQAEPVAGLVADLNSLQSSYSALNIDEQIKNNRADLVLTDKNLVEITKIVEKVRKGITE
ncbi:MAG: hypothetical protein K1X47_06870 [Cyclobacteriaceae bacterium]|nr:hypothetical protein [Cyclobacteriaceae bacterium]